MSSEDDPVFVFVESSPVLLPAWLLQPAITKATIPITNSLVFFILLFYQKIYMVIFYLAGVYHKALVHSLSCITAANFLFKGGLCLAARYIVHPGRWNF